MVCLKSIISSVKETCLRDGHLGLRAKTSKDEHVVLGQTFLQYAYLFVDIWEGRVGLGQTNWEGGANGRTSPFAFKDQYDRELQAGYPDEGTDEEC